MLDNIHESVEFIIISFMSNDESEHDDDCVFLDSDND